MSRFTNYGNPYGNRPVIYGNRPDVPEVTTIYSTGEVVRQTRTGALVQRPAVPPVHGEPTPPVASLNIDMDCDVL